MQEHDKVKFSVMMNAAGEVYSKEITKPLLRLYFDALSQMTIQQAESAMMAHMRDPSAGQYFPKPADIIRQITGTEKQQAIAVEDRASMAWACIEREIRRIGSYGALELDDKQALAAVKAIGGWKSICASTTEELTWKRKEFIGSYATYERTPIEMLPSKLPGLIELSEHKTQSQQGLKSLRDGIAKYRLGANLGGNQNDD